MPSLAISLAQSLAQSLGSSIGNGDWEFSNFTVFANASERYVINPETGVITGPFASGIPAVIWIDGKRYLQVEAADTCKVLRNTDLTYGAYWLKWIAGDTLAATTSPVGTSDAWIHTLDAVSNQHLISQTIVVRTVAVCAKSNGVQYAMIRGTIAGNYVQVFCDLTTGVLNEYVSGGGINVTVKRSAPLAWGGYYIEVTFDVDTTAIAVAGWTNNTGPTCLGDGINGAILWLPQGSADVDCEGSPIMTAGAAVTRAKDQSYIPALSVPWFIKDKSKWLWYPKYPNSQIAAGEKRYICRFEDSGSNSVGLYYFGTDQKFYLEVDGVDSFSSGATTHSANQKLEVTLDRIAGSITLANFTTGNGETVGTPWNRPDGDLKIGQDSSEANQIDGVIRLEKTT